MSEWQIKSGRVDYRTIFLDSSATRHVLDDDAPKLVRQLRDFVNSGGEIRIPLPSFEELMEQLSKHSQFWEKWHQSKKLLAQLVSPTRPLAAEAEKPETRRRLSIEIGGEAVDSIIAAWTEELLWLWRVFLWSGHPSTFDAIVFRSSSFGFGGFSFAEVSSRKENRLSDVLDLMKRIHAHSRRTGLSVGDLEKVVQEAHKQARIHKPDTTMMIGLRAVRREQEGQRDRNVPYDALIAAYAEMDGAVVASADSDIYDSFPGNSIAIVRM